ncbi:MAG: energy-coupling factor ABC transporter ATP-binding protein [Candidatus Thorarchaeota archaeon]|jgi:energy-coupling factor transporter ATP-binding protein EcfA2
MALLEFADFSFKYLGADSLALRKISLSIDQGEYVVITGPSGCGKTTLCRAINGLVPQFHRGYIAGHVYTEGKDTRESNVSQLAKTAGMVFQNPSNQLVTLNVEKEIAFGPENLGVEPEEIRRRVEWVAIAATLALEPKILVADEPTSNLDPRSAEIILDIIADQNREGMTVVLVEHRLDLVSKDASRLILMDKGSIVADGTPREVLVMDLCEDIGIGVPKATQVYRRLKERGIDLDMVPLTGEELAAFVQEARVT